MNKNQLNSVSERRKGRSLSAARYTNEREMNNNNDCNSSFVSTKLLSKYYRSGVTGERTTTPKGYFLEMEKENRNGKQEEEEEAPIQTTSGLLLTHRKSTPPIAINSRNHASRRMFAPLNGNPLEEVHFVPLSSSRYSSATSHPYSLPSKGKSHRTILSMWVTVVLLVIGSTILSCQTLLHFKNKTAMKLSPLEASLSTFNNKIVLEEDAILPILYFKNLTQQHQPLSAAGFGNTNKNKKKQHIHKKGTTTTTTAISLLPTNLFPHHHSSTKKSHPSYNHLIEPFLHWMKLHERNYGTKEEQKRRFHIWAKNQEIIQRKNQRHGPCKLTGQDVFGSNHFQDLTEEEFYQQYLTGYTASVHLSSEEKTADLPPNLQEVTHSKNHLRFLKTTHNIEHFVMELRHPVHGISRHASVQRKFEQHWNEQKRRRLSVEKEEETDEAVRTAAMNTWYTNYKETAASARTTWCSWDVCGTNPNCWINCALDYMSGSGGGTMIPSSSSANVESVDWRKVGVVTSVHSQGNCGACWAITAVETIESCYAIQSGNLYDLDESEVIVCDSTCQMCNGGWPQNAYEYVAKQKGLRREGSRSSSTYNGDFLISLTMSSTGQSDTLSASDIESVKSEMCTSDSSTVRYGSITNWGYSTDRCICYSNGSGCDCTNQNEAKAIQNIATYGPAAICLDASTWKEYKGGIMTPDSGCSSKFLAMNHCVQVVGYIFTDSATSSSSSNANENNNNRKDEKDKTSYSQREGYFIVRNQWGSNWGMNGYAYLSLGNNTCGILNDMTHAYMD